MQSHYNCFVLNHANSISEYFIIQDCSDPRGVWTKLLKACVSSGNTESVTDGICLWKPLTVSLYNIKCVIWRIVFVAELLKARIGITRASIKLRSVCYSLRMKSDWSFWSINRTVQRFYRVILSDLWTCDIGSHFKKVLYPEIASLNPKGHAQISLGLWYHDLWSCDCMLRARER